MLSWFEMPTEGDLTELRDICTLYLEIIIALDSSEVIMIPLG